MPQHGPPQEGECTRQVAVIGNETGPRSLIRNRKPHRKTQDTIRESRPPTAPQVDCQRCSRYGSRAGCQRGSTQGIRHHSHFPVVEGMAQSFGIVEEKICEAHFFLEKLAASSPDDGASRFNFSAFISAARSTTLALQASMNGVPDFGSWYNSVQDEIITDPLMSFFKELRNDSIHKGLRIP